MSIKKTNRRKKQKQQRPRASKKFTPKARLASGKKTAAKSNAVKSKPAKHKVSHKKKIVGSTAAVRRKTKASRRFYGNRKVWEPAPVWGLETFRAFPFLRTQIRRAPRSCSKKGRRSRLGSSAAWKMLRMRTSPK